MELAAGEPLFARMAYLDPADYADILEDAVAVMQDRQVRLRGVTRLHQPSPAEPLIVILIDELAALSYVNERDLRRRIDNALGLLLSQGRAVGVTVIGAIQDPRKETLPARDLFPVRIALRLARPTMCGWCSAPAPGTAAPAVTRSRTACPGSASSKSTAYPNRSGSASPGSPTTTSGCSPPAGDRRLRCLASRTTVTSLRAVAA